MERDGFKCRDYGNEKETLHVHHCAYAKGEPWETPIQFMVTVCKTCHGLREFAEGELKNEFAVMLVGFGEQNRADLFNAFQCYRSDILCDEDGRLVFVRRRNLK